MVAFEDIEKILTMPAYTQKILIVLSLVAFISSLISMYSMRSIAKRTLNCSVCQISKKYYVEVSPSGRAHTILWPIIYAWNLFSIIYICVSLFLPEKISPVKFVPTLIPCRFLVGFIVVFASKIAFLFTYIMESLWLTFSLMAISAATSCYITGVCHKLVYDNIKVLEENYKNMLRITRGVILNGLCLLSTWFIFSCCGKLTRVIIYKGTNEYGEAITRGISVKDGSTMVMATQMVAMMVWFVLENFTWEKYLRYSFTVFPALIHGCVGVLVKLKCHHCNPGSKQNIIFASISLGFCILAFIFRIASFFHRRKKGFDGASQSDKAMSVMVKL